MHPSRQAALGLPNGSAAAQGEQQQMSQPVKPHQGPWSSAALDAASHGAIAFCQIYYEAYDEPTRRETEVPQLFLPNAKILWNGTPILPDYSNFAGFLKGMPFSRHDLQTLDCHPVPALDPAAPPNSAPDIIVNVTGSVLHGPHVMAGFDDHSSATTPQNHPRKFHEMFMLRAAEQGEGMQPKLKFPLHRLGLDDIGGAVPHNENDEAQSRLLSSHIPHYIYPAAPLRGGAALGTRTDKVLVGISKSILM